MFSQQPYSSISPIQHIVQFFQKRSMLSQLILINIGVWLIIALMNVGAFLLQSNTSSLISWLALPADMSIFLIKPWTIFSYMFLHENILHILFNMLMLFFSGKIFLEFLNEKQLLTTYILGGLSGGIIYMLSYNFFPRFDDVVTYSILLGASASVIAILISVAMYVPNYMVNLIFVGAVKLKHIAFVFIVIDLLSIDKGNSGGHLAHLGGALWGIMYAIQLKKGIDIATKLSPLFNIFKSSKKSNMYVNKKYTNKRSTNDEEYNRQRKEKQIQIDIILEKISKSGYDSLSKKEKELLFDASNK